MIKLIDLFSGCGGFTEGFKQAGFTPTLAVEWERFSAATYFHNFGNHVIQDDIWDIPLDAYPSADVIIGGPPCQGFSNLGTKDPNDPRNNLIFIYVDILKHVQPKVFVVENVPLFLQSKQFTKFKSLTSELLDNYQISSTIMNAADYGVPQLRKRAIIVGVKNGKFTFPAKTHKERITLREAFEGIPLFPDSKVLPSNRKLKNGIPGPFSSDELHITSTSKMVELRCSYVPPSGNRHDIPYELKAPYLRRKDTGYVDVYGRLEWDKPSVTIRTDFTQPGGGRYIHPQWENPKINRGLTLLEGIRIQSFPDNYLWCGSKTGITKQIGNAVPPLLAKTIATQIKSQIFT